MILCPKCGDTSTDETKCSVCGEVFQQQVTYDEQDNNPQSESVKITKSVISIATGIASLALACFTVLFSIISSSVFLVEGDFLFTFNSISADVAIASGVVGIVFGVIYLRSGATKACNLSNIGKKLGLAGIITATLSFLISLVTFIL